MIYKQKSTEKVLNYRYTFLESLQTILGAFNVERSRSGVPVYVFLASRVGNRDFPLTGLSLDLDVELVVPHTLLFFLFFNPLYFFLFHSAVETFIFSRIDSNAIVMSFFLCGSIHIGEFSRTRPFFKALKKPCVCSNNVDIKIDQFPTNFSRELTAVLLDAEGK